MILYTHGFDLVMKLAAAALILVLWVCAYESGFDWFGPPDSAQSLFILVAIGFVVIYVPVYGMVLKRVGNFLYVRVSLRTAVGWRDMKALDPLFCLDRQLQWCAMREVRDMAPERRREYLLEQAARLADTRVVGWWRYIV